MKLLLLAFLVTLNACAETLRLGFTNGAEGLIFSSNLYDESLKTTCPWNITNAPPFAPQEAIKTADRALESALTGANKISQKRLWKLRNVVLKNIEEDYWVYVVEYYFQSPRRTYVPTPLRIIVLMDGTVIPLRRVTLDDKGG
jgi:hypothetical protein